MWPFPKIPESLRKRVNELERRVERVETHDAERQLAVLTASERVMHQLRARESKRDRDAEPEANGVKAPPGQHLPPPKGLTFPNSRRGF